MTREMIINAVNALNEDAFISMDNDKAIYVVLVDCEGYDDIRDYDNPEAVADFLTMLQINSNSYVEGFYDEYHFNDFKVIVGYLSYDD